MAITSDALSEEVSDVGGGSVELAKTARLGHSSSVKASSSVPISQLKTVGQQNDEDMLRAARARCAAYL